MKRTAFISHSSKDKAIGEAVCSFLEQNGIPCWIAPRDVTPGKNYGVAIVDAIDECGVFVLILSAESNKSGQVVREVERAASANSVIIPVRVELVHPSRDLEFYVSSSHWLDATQKPLEQHLGSLLEAIRNWQGKGEPREGGTPSATPASHPSPARQSNLPLIVGGVVVAIGIVGLAIFLANRPKSGQPAVRTASAVTSPTVRPNLPRMGRRQAAREQAASESSVASSVTPAVGASASTAPNENIPPGPAPAIERIVASSERPPVMYMGAMKHFEAKHAFDGDLKTVWIPVGSGPGQSIEVFFKTPTAISSVSIFGGSGVDAERYSNNNRVQDIRMTYSNGFSRVLTLADKMEMQRFELPAHPILQWIKFEIVSVYHGNKNDATPIAEIQFNRPE